MEPEPLIPDRPPQPSRPLYGDSTPSQPWPAQAPSGPYGAPTPSDPYGAPTPGASYPTPTWSYPSGPLTYPTSSPYGPSVQVDAPPQPPVQAARSSSLIGGLIVMVGGSALFISAFFPWMLVHIAYGALYQAHFSFSAWSTTGGVLATAMGLVTALIAIALYRGSVNWLPSQGVCLIVLTLVTLGGLATAIWQNTHLTVDTLSGLTTTFAPAFFIGCGGAALMLVGSIFTLFNQSH